MRKNRKDVKKQGRKNSHRNVRSKKGSHKKPEKATPTTFVPVAVGRKRKTGSQSTHRGDNDFKVLNIANYPHGIRGWTHTKRNEKEDEGGVELFKKKHKTTRKKPRDRQHTLERESGVRAVAFVETQAGLRKRGGKGHGSSQNGVKESRCIRTD